MLKSANTAQVHDFSMSPRENARRFCITMAPFLFVFFLIRIGSFVYLPENLHQTKEGALFILVAGVLAGTVACLLSQAEKLRLDEEGVVLGRCHKVLWKDISQIVVRGTSLRVTGITIHARPHRLLPLYVRGFKNLDKALEVMEGRKTSTSVVAFKHERRFGSFRFWLTLLAALGILDFLVVALGL
ncbi:MAG: hypothetical protein IT364_20065 [Candidatus Hydrogenedentes bacterium]|nr:hypothetical protein [Candidatus Hydrogenedentota bacterium]